MTITYLVHCVARVCSLRVQSTDDSLRDTVLDEVIQIGVNTALVVAIIRSSALVVLSLLVTGRGTQAWAVG